MTLWLFVTPTFFGSFSANILLHLLNKSHFSLFNILGGKQRLVVIYKWTVKIRGGT